MTFIKVGPLASRGKASKEPPPRSEIADKINKAKQARKDGQALRAGKPKIFDNWSRIKW